MKENTWSEAKAEVEEDEACSGGASSLQERTILNRPLKFQCKTVVKNFNTDKLIEKYTFFNLTFGSSNKLCTSH